ncbi:ATP-binding protein [Rhodocytophaga aerolata]|uniref:histidine kinase n=1 Tax=Rhodocytophaga aerolata TaxID=455078 RepID=A0ABT8RCM8_9BACT|nr:ATP-binding protein [Rhodocytophaga aerolata]MDO1449857.1 ATP-binding protein [Rhodocytophaga aerolata]
MKIRTRLTLNFTLIVASILAIFSLSVYFSSFTHRKNDFYTRLEERVKTTTRLLIEVDEVDEALLQIIERNNLTSLPEQQISVYNQDNQVIYTSDETPDAVAGTQQIFDQIRSEKQIRFRKGNREAIGFTVTYHNKQYTIIASAIDRYGLSELIFLRTILATGLIASLIIVALAGWLYAGRALRPVSEMINHVSKIKASNLHSRVCVGKSQDELALLATTFNQMLDRVQDAFEVQRSFVANASHEMRTPLTIITGKIEVTLIKPRTVQEHEEKWKSVLADISHLNKLSNNLLELAHVSLGMAQINLSRVSLDEVVYKAGKKLLSNQPGYTMVFEFDNELENRHPSLTISGDESLLVTAFLNLMENGCKYSSDSQVKVILGANEKEIIIQFQDQGIGIDKQDAPYIFQPFFRSEHAKSIKGHGIGLSLTQRIIQLHQGEISFSSVLEQGTTFTLRFPTAF